MMETAAPTDEAAKVTSARGEPVVVVLQEPIQFGSQLISEISIRPSAKAFRGFSVPLTGDGGLLFQPYELAAVGIRMAGQPTAVLDKLGVADMAEIAQVVMGFISPGLKTGSTPSR